MAMRRIRRTGVITVISFAIVMAMAEAVARVYAPSLPIDPGEWPRIEIAQKLQQLQDWPEHSRRADVLFVGSSMTADGVDPNVFSAASGLDSYNAAFAGPSVRTIAPWTTNVVVPLIQPKVVVVGVQTRELNDKGPKNVRVYQKFMSSPGYKQSVSTLGHLEHGLEDFSAFLRYRRAFRHPSEWIHHVSDPFKGVHVRQQIGPRGARIQDPVDYRVTDKFDEHLYDETLVHFTLGGPEFESLVNLYKTLRSEGIRLVVMSMPVTSDYWAVHPNPNKDRREYHALLHRYAAETGGTVIDAENAFPDTTPFREPIHLDVEGADALSRALGKDWDRVVSAGPGFLHLKCTAGDSPRCRIT